MLIISTLIFLLTIFPIFLFFRIRRIPSLLLVLYLSFFGLIVFTTEISGILGHLSSQAVFLSIQIIELFLMWGIWIILGKPNALNDFKKNTFLDGLRDIYRWIIKNPFGTFIFFVSFIGYVVLAWLIIRVPPNNSDSMHTHLARVMYWLQQDNFKLLTCHSPFAKIYPFNAQLNLLWTILFSESDKYVGFVQYFAALFGGVAIYGISRNLKGSKSISLLSIFFWLSYPMVIFQATSTQFDLVITALLVSSVYFLFDYISHRTRGSVFFSALAMGLALGTKQTIFMVGAGYFLIGLIILLKEKGSINWLIRWSALTLICFLLLGSFMYFSNVYHFHNPLGPTEHVKSDSIGTYSFSEKARYNLPRFIYQFISFDGLPNKIWESGTRFKSVVFNNIDIALNLGLEKPNAIKEAESPFLYNTPSSFNEDTAWFGITSFMILPLSIVFASYRSIKKKEWLPVYLLILAISFLFFEILLRPGWDPFQGRYFLLFVAILTPLIALIPDNKLWGKFFLFILCLCAIIQLFFSVFSNEVKPILGKRIFEYRYVEMENSYVPKNIFQSQYRKYSLKFYGFFLNQFPFSNSIEDYDDITLRTFPFRSSYDAVIRKVNEVIPDDAIVGVILSNGDYDYTFFGSELKRILIPINPISNLFNPQWINDNDLGYIVITDKEFIPLVPEYLELIEEIDGWRFFKVLRN